MEPYQPQSGWTLVASATLLQMVCEEIQLSSPAHAVTAVVELGASDVPEMIGLTTLTKPGPFNQRTHELGSYLGVRRECKLVAMAGERLKVPGFTEVSAVCTHPEHTGRGYAGLLMIEVMQRIRGQEETPFLHVREDNTRAIELYKRLGFVTRAQVQLAVLRKTPVGD
jgi:predicted GNAT family acetyltransferase